MLALFPPGVAAADQQTRPIEFHHEEYGVEQLQTLRRLYDYDEYAREGESELEQMLLLQQWVFDTIAYGGAREYTQLRNSLTILSKARQGEVFWCNNFAAVFMQCAVSLGWTARYVFFRTPLGDTHISNDIWSNELEKWILLDATWNIHIRKNGVPLSIAEIRQEWIENDGADLEYIYGAADRAQSYSARELPIERDESMLWKWWPVDDQWISFTYAVAYLTRNDLFSYGDGEGSSIWNDILVIRDDLNRNDQSWEFRRRPAVENLEDLYHDLNRVDMRLVPDYRWPRSTSGDVLLSLDAYGDSSYTPNLGRLLVRIDSGEWRTAEPLLRVDQPRDATVVVEARIRNRFGVLGPVSRLEIPPQGP